jgi:hypothetical protein
VGYVATRRELRASQQFDILSDPTSGKDFLLYIPAVKDSNETLEQLKKDGAIVSDFEIARAIAGAVREEASVVDINNQIRLQRNIKKLQNRIERWRLMSEGALFDVAPILVF